MTTTIDSLSEISGRFDAIVLDQWGVLHDGTTPYPGAPGCLAALKSGGTRLAVLSNSGKRAAPNADRIAAMGFDQGLFDCIMTSGEALWQDIAAGLIAARCLYPIVRANGDAEAWADGLDILLTDQLQAADAILLMGLPDDASHGAFDVVFQTARAQSIPVLCTNPDRASPRTGGAVVVSPGALAHDHVKRGGIVNFYGKPHLPVFRAVQTALDLAPDRLLMVGDSLEHDIAGAVGAGWASVLVRNGLHASAFQPGANITRTVADLATSEAAPMPTYTLAQLG